MVHKILTAAQITHAETMFLQQPEGVFAVYGDKMTAGGSDYETELIYHDVVVELYEPSEWAGREERDRLIDALDCAYSGGLIDRWDCEMRVWLADVRLFMTTFNFSYIDRR